jgi:hypothetical protein
MSPVSSATVMKLPAARMPAGRVVPAHQRLDREQLAGAQVELRLVVEQQAGAVDRLPQEHLDVRALLHRRPEALVEGDGPVAALALGEAKGCVRRRQEVLADDDAEVLTAMPMLASS